MIRQVRDTVIQHRAQFANALGIVGEFCLRNGLPALNCIVVGQQTGTPGHGVVVSKNKTWRDDARDSLNTDWFKFRVPSTGTLRKLWEEFAA